MNKTIEVLYSFVKVIDGNKTSPIHLDNGNMNQINNPQVEFISSSETLDLRKRILRPGQIKKPEDIKLCQYPEDDFESTFHLGIRLHNLSHDLPSRDIAINTNEKNKIICNGTFIQQANPEHFQNAKKPYRLRGMATETEFQNKGLGRTILTAAIVELKKRDCDLLWFNARTSAEYFYQKLGFGTIGNVFDLPMIGPHKVMYIEFKNR